MVYIEWVTVTEAFDEVFHNVLFWVLLSLITFDFISGTFKAIKEKKLDSSTGTHGLMKHTSITLLIVIVGVFSSIAGFEYIAYGIMIAFIFEYIISIIENMESLGVNFPDWVSETVERLQKDHNDKWGKK